MTEKSKKLEPQRQAAHIRIGKKLDILEQWLTEGIPFVLVDGNKQIDAKGNYVLEHFPKSVRGLRLWNGEENSKDVVEQYQIPTTQTSDATWKAAPSALRIRAEGYEDKLSIFALLKEKAAIQRSNKQKTKIQELEEKLAFSEMNREGLAKELIQLRLDNNFLESELSTAESRLADAQHVMNNQLTFKTKAIKQAENDNKSLSILVNKLTEKLAENNIDMSDIGETTSVIKFPVIDNE